MSDRVVRAMTDDGAFRLIAAVTTSTARGAMAAQGIAGPLAGRLAELLTGAILVRETTAPGRRVQLVMRYQAGGTLVADSLPTGMSRGLVTEAAEADERGFGGDAILQVNYTLPNGALHQGLIDVPAGADVSSALMRYLHQSEQTVSMVVVEALLDDGELRAAGGYLVQLLPEASRDGIEAMTTRLEGFEQIAALRGEAPSPDQMLGALFDGLPHTRLADSSLAFGCTCSEERVLAGILSLPSDDIREMADAAQAIDVRCDACGRRYEVEPATLRALSMRPHNAAKD
jgi:molecular chaperone Hsp33